MPDALPSTFLFALRDVGATALASDALPETPIAFAPFGLRSALLELSSPTVGNLYIQSDGLDAPEPLAAIAGATALAALVTLARRRG